MTNMFPFRVFLQSLQRNTKGLIQIVREVNLNTMPKVVGKHEVITITFSKSSVQG